MQPREKLPNVVDIHMIFAAKGRKENNNLKREVVCVWVVWGNQITHIKGGSVCVVKLVSSGTGQQKFSKNGSPQKTRTSLKKERYGA